MTPLRFQIFTRTSDSSSTADSTTRPTAATAAGWRVSSPLVTTGSTTPCARTSAVVRASTMASRSPMRRLAINVANPTITHRDETREHELAHLRRDRPPSAAVARDGRCA